MTAPGTRAAEPVAARVQTGAVLFLRLALAVVFVWAAVPKLLDPGEFAASIQNYRVLPESLTGKLAVMLPVAELVLALGFLVNPLQRGAALLGALMLLGFSVAMAQARVRGIDLSCGCFGAALDSKVSWWTVLRTFGLALLAGYVLFASAKLQRRRAPEAETGTQGGASE